MVEDNPIVLKHDIHEGNLAFNMIMSFGAIIVGTIYLVYFALISTIPGDSQGYFLLFVVIMMGVISWPGFSGKLIIHNQCLIFRYGLLFRFFKPKIIVNYSEIQSVEYNKLKQKLIIKSYSRNKNTEYLFSWRGLSNNEKSQWFESLKQKGLEIQVIN